MLEPLDSKNAFFIKFLTYLVFKLPYKSLKRLFNNKLYLNELLNRFKNLEML